MRLEGETVAEGEFLTGWDGTEGKDSEGKGVVVEAVVGVWTAGVVDSLPGINLWLFTYSKIYLPFS